MVETSAVDFAVAAFHVDGAWQVESLADPVLLDVEALATGLRRFPADGGALAMIGLDDDVFLLVRTSPTQVHLLLSDITAADEWDLARTAIERLGLPFPEDEDDPAPAGELDLLADLGLIATELAALVDDDRFSDDVLAEIAERLGFGPAFDDAVGQASV